MQKPYGVNNTYNVCDFFLHKNLCVFYTIFKKKYKLLL